MPARLRRGFRANHQTLAMVPASPTAATKGLTNFRPLLTQGTLVAKRCVTLCDHGAITSVQPSVERKTFLTSENDAIASIPSSRPNPDCFIPPNGAFTRTEVLEFTESVPACTAFAMRRARLESRVQIEPDSPYGVSLARATAWASSSKGVTATTGPKISSRQTRSRGSTGARTVAGNHHPGPSGTRLVPAISSPESPLSTYPSTRAR